MTFGLIAVDRAGSNGSPKSLTCLGKLFFKRKLIRPAVVKRSDILLYYKQKMDIIKIKDRAIEDGSYRTILFLLFQSQWILYF